jgi:hypothetical protein
MIPDSERKALAAYLTADMMEVGDVRRPVRVGEWCGCTQPVDSEYSEQVGAEVCGVCHGVVRDDAAREAK